MSSYFDKLNQYYKSDKADNDNQRFVKQVRNTWISAAIIIGLVFLVTVLIFIISGIQSIFSYTAVLFRCFTALPC